MSKVSWKFELLVTTFCWVSLCASGVHRNEQVYRSTYGVVTRKVETLMIKEAKPLIDMLQQGIVGDVTKKCYVKTFQTNSSFILLDFCNEINKQLKKQLHGSELLNYTKMVQSEPLEQTTALRMDYRIPKIIHRSDGSQFVTDHPCVVYNISGIQDNVTYRSCDPWNFRHLLKETLRPIFSVINIYLIGVPIQDLLIADLIYFPKVTQLFLNGVPLTSESLENELLCTSPHLEVFHFHYSLGYLQKFPSHNYIQLFWSTEYCKTFLHNA